MEDAARKVEREMQKRIAAVVLHPRIGQSFQAIVTGVNQLRHLRAHARSRTLKAWWCTAAKGLDVGDRVTVKLVSTDPAARISSISRRKTFLLQVCPEASSLKFRFPQEIGTLHITSNGYILRRNAVSRRQSLCPN